MEDQKPAATSAAPRRRSKPSSSKRGSQKVEASQSPWQRVSHIAIRYLDLFISLEPKVLKGKKTEAIHDLRVASRRLQQVLDLIYAKPRPPKIRKLRRRARRSRRILSLIRNCDVLIALVEKRLARKNLTGRDIWITFRDYLEEKRAGSFREASERLADLKLASSYVYVKHELEAPNWSATPLLPATDGDLGVIQQLSFEQRMVQSLGRTWASMSDCIAESEEKPSAAALHAVRIAAKRLRYLLEVMREMGVEGSGDAVACLRLLQQHLGEWHDLEVLELEMLEMASQPEFVKNHLELAIDVEKLVLRNRRVKRAHEGKYFEFVRRSSDWKNVERWVSSLLAPVAKVSSEA